MPNETHDPEVDIDPQDALELDYDEAGDIADADAEPNDQVDEDFEHVEGAQPVDEALADEEIPVDDAFEADEDDDDEEDGQ